MRFLINCAILIIFLAVHSFSFSQSNISVPDSISSFVFAKGANSQIKLLTPFGSHILKDSIFLYEKFKSLNSISEFLTFISFASEESLIIFFWSIIGIILDAADKP